MTMATQSLPAAAEGRRIRVWDLPLRLFHWTLVAAIALALLAIAAFDLLAHSGWVPTFWIADLAQPLKAVAKLGR